MLCCESFIRTRVCFLLPLGKWALQLGDGMHPGGGPNWSLGPIRILADLEGDLCQISFGPRQLRRSDVPKKFSLIGGSHLPPARYSFDFQLRDTRKS